MCYYFLVSIVFFMHYAPYKLLISDWSSDLCSSDLASPCTTDWPRAIAAVALAGSISSPRASTPLSRSAAISSPSPQPMSSTRVPAGTASAMIARSGRSVMSAPVPQGAGDESVERGNGDEEAVLAEGPRQSP